MENRFFLFLLILLTGIASVQAQESNASAGDASSAQGEQIVDAPLEEPLLTPVVKRNKIKLAKIDTENFQLGAYGGLLSVEDFGVYSVYGIRFGLLLSESYFLDATMGVSKVDRSSAERLFNFDLLSAQERELIYYDVSFGFNILPGEAFVGEDTAYTTALYFSIGAGSTTFAGDDRFTIVGGFGYRLVWTDWLAIQIDFRDHVFESDVLGENELKHNFEFTVGTNLFF